MGLGGAFKVSPMINGKKQRWKQHYLDGFILKRTN